MKGSPTFLGIIMVWDVIIVGIIKIVKGSINCMPWRRVKKRSKSFRFFYDYFDFLMSFSVIIR